MFVGKPDTITVIPSRSVKVAKVVEEVVKNFNEEHGVEPYNRDTNEGLWRILLYRESKKTKECMISIVLTDNENGKAGPAATPEVLALIKNAIQEKFKAGDMIDEYKL
mmetsp:Transcript_11077/g.16844  ORF Transcript_11077/g.16844 Transcript_11077/m.16844 type:complete len:108 (-) Transcript_11077:719-1042(-)